MAPAACDRQPEAIIVPEFEFAFSFESGLGGWTSGQADVGSGSASASASSATASDGSRAVAFDLDNTGGAGKVWITRELTVTEDQSYTVEVTFDVFTSDPDGGDAWKLILGLRDTAPSVAAELDYQGDTASGTDGTSGGRWVAQSYTVAAKADEDGKLFLTLGIWGTSTGTRSYAVDNVRLALTRS